MKKDRNAFFQEAQFSNMNYYPNPPMPISQGSSSFYSGPINPQNNMNYNNNNELESRLSKIERQIQRLDARLSKLENLNTNLFNADDVTSNSSMYMI